MTQYLSSEAYRSLKQELKELKTTRRREIAQKLQEAKELGDLSENAAYQEAKREQSELETKILEIEEFLRNASIIRKSKNHNGLVRIGSTITVVLMSQPKVKKVFTISGSLEANPKLGKISNVSPLGKAFLGHKKGDVVIVKTPKGMVKYKIIDIK